MAKKRLAKALYEMPSTAAPAKERRAEIKQVKNGFVVSGGYDPKTGMCPQYVAATEEEAKKLASKLL